MNMPNERQTIPKMPDTMLRSPANADMYIRRSNFYWTGGSYPATPDLALEVRDRQVDIMRSCGIRVPEYRTLQYGLSVGSCLLRVVEEMEHVSGKELILAVVHKGDIDTSEFNQYFTGLTKYMRHVARDGGFYMSDAVRALDQAVYGTRAGEQDPRIYYVDTEPLLEYYDSATPANPFNQRFFTRLDCLAGAMRLTHRCGYDVGESLQAFNHFYQEIAPLRPADNPKYTEVYQKT